MENRKIELKDLLTENQIAELKNGLAEMPQKERESVMPYIRHYIAAAICERLPDIQKISLRNLCVRIVRKEFAFACQG